VSFHVEVSRSFRRAHLFNLSEAELSRQLLEPWSHGRPLAIGDREWDPSRSSFRILEGPELAPQELAFGRGWSNAARKSRDVTRELLAPSPTAVAVLAETPQARGAVTSLLDELGLRATDWSAVRARVLDSGGAADVAAAVIVLEGAPRPQDWLEIGLAIGAMRGRAILTQRGEATLPDDLARDGVIRLDVAEPDPSQALAERLRQLGLTTRPPEIRRAP
jgi:hypothetical protein